MAHTKYSMFTLDFRTVFLSYTIINIVSLVLIGSLYIQLKQRFPETLLILLSFLMTTVGNILVFLRDAIPDFISISLANLFTVGSTVILLIAFEKFAKKKGIKIQNVVLLLIFFLVHTYFAFIKPDLTVRSINFSVAYILLSFQVAFLMLIRVPVNMRKITRPIGIIFCAIFIIQFFRVIFLWKNGLATTSYLNSELSESIFILIWEIILIFLAFSIILMYNKRLITDINVQEEKFSKAFHAAPFIIMLSKFSDGKVFEVNKSIQSISGYHLNEIIGLKTTDLNMWKNNDDRHTFISELKTNGIVTENEYKFRKKSGELFTGLISANIIEINNEQSIISVITDITERKRTEIKLKKSEAGLRELNSTKDKFFSIIAHDLKSPFNSILGFSELIHEKVTIRDYEGLENYTEIIKKSSNHAMDLLSNLMEWAMAQTGRKQFNPEYIDITALIKSSVELLHASVVQKTIHVTVNQPHNLIVFADRAMIETVLRNILSNAIKFTSREGKVIVTAEEKQNECVVSVSDNGMGISENNIEKLFRIDGDFTSPGTENEKGTGLGLILCREFIEKHNGKIWVESEPEVGSKFYFSLPKS